MRKLSLHSVIERNPNIIAADAGTDVIMVHIEKGHYYAVSEIAREVWEAIDRPRRVSDLISVLVENYNVDRALCERDTLDFLEELMLENLVMVKSGCNVKVTDTAAS